MIINLSKIDFGGIAAGGKSKPEEVFDVQPTTSDQTITPAGGSVFSGGTVRAVTSEIDNNIVAGNIKEGVSILGVAGTLKEETGIFVVPPDMRFGGSTFAEVPSYLDFSKVTSMDKMFWYCAYLTSVPSIITSNIVNMANIFTGCGSLTNLPQMNTSNVVNMDSAFSATPITTVPPLDTHNVKKMTYLFGSCSNLTTVEGIDFSGLTSELKQLFGWDSNKSKITRFIVNGKINVSISDNYGTRALTAIDYDSVKSILTAASNTDNTNSKTLAFSRTMTDQNGELAALVASCTTKGWTITGLTLQ